MQGSTSRPHKPNKQGILTCCAKLAIKPKAFDVLLNIGWLQPSVVASTIISGGCEFEMGDAILLWLCLFIAIHFFSFRDCSFLITHLYVSRQGQMTVRRYCSNLCYYLSLSSIWRVMMSCLFPNCRFRIVTASV